MPEDKPRLARLTAIITQLQSKRMVTARDIAEKHNVSIRTVYRDMRTLEQSGIPIITEEGRGYAIMEGYKLPPVMFTEEEANALVTAGKIILNNTDHSLAEQYQSAATKVRAVLKHTQKEKVELLESRLQIRSKQQNVKTSKFLITLQTAITDYQVVQIDYLSLENKQSQRKVEPFALFCTNENWVLIAYCQLRDDFRAFRLDCIQSMQLTGTVFEPHKITLSEYFEQCQENRNHP